MNTEETSASDRRCAAGIHEVFDMDADVPIEVQRIAERMIGQLGQLGVATVQVDGQWYVSPRSRSPTCCSWPCKVSSRVTSRRSSTSWRHRWMIWTVTGLSTR